MLHVHLLAVKYEDAFFVFDDVTVPDPGKGVCADPVNGAAILGKEGPDPQGGNKARQLSPDKGRRRREKTTIGQG
jgi:hypothetical protein